MSAPPARRMLNLGCGHRFHPDWVNVDLAPRHSNVMRWDLSRGIPFPDCHFDVVYHSHLLEHIRRSDALPFLRHCRRVLKPAGILRVATPDLERLCELYLEKLRAVAVDGGGARNDHEWLVIEMYDQTVREQSGGAMLDYLRQNPLLNEGFVRERIGEEGRELLEAIRRPRSAEVPQSRATGRFMHLSRHWLARLRGRVIRSWYGKDALTALGIGMFRLSGEVHHWLYDRVSLARLLVVAGFDGPVVRTASESAISGWPHFCLDTTPAGDVVKPDSFFMEASKGA